MAAARWGVSNKRHPNRLAPRGVDSFSFCPLILFLHLPSIFFSGKGALCQSRKKCVHGWLCAPREQWCFFWAN